MRNTLTTLAATSTVLLSATAMADGPRWHFVEGGYTTMDFDGYDGGFDPDGFVIKGMTLIAPQIYVHGEYDYMESDLFDENIDVNTLTVGVGYIMPLSTRTDAFASINYERLDVDGNDPDGFSLDAGVRSMITNVLELSGQIGYLSWDGGDDDLTFKVGAQYYFDPQFSVGASYENLDSYDVTQVTVRYHF
ncbi:outer membrane beta-barrel protein [Pseudobowmanella zhangzhouensis]|uniref:outer membrane beta-barrel protein n=1 Tax=Pseudobowmanella zhangzhouensis TaxID=1537679 RepID=UPI0036095B6C